jgi:3-hydroxybutyryl-CoA dehydrogenase
MNVERVGVVGAGQMGNGIAQVFAAAGFEVLMSDVSGAALQRGMEAIRRSLERFVAKDKITAADAEATLTRVAPIDTLDELSGVDVVVEAATENESLKRRIFEQLDRVCPAHAVLATNTSSISITRIAAYTGRPEKVIGMHFMNPVPLMSLVEIIRALQTDAPTYQQTEALCRTLGKVPVQVKDGPGFVSNRILMPMINEAIYTLYEGLAEPEAIDSVMKLGMNQPMGPLALADLIGLDTCLAIMNVLHEGFGDSKYRPCPLLRQMVDAGYLGRKSGRGFYAYAV